MPALGAQPEGAQPHTALTDKVDKPSAPAPAPEEQARQVSAAWRDTLGKGETWYVLDLKWWSQFCSFAGLDAKQGTVVEPTGGSAPGPIDNSALKDPAQPVALASTLQEGLDYTVVHQEVWNLLHMWYGGGPVFDRSVQTIGIMEETRLDMFPVFLSCVWLGADGQPDNSQVHTRRFARDAMLSSVATQAQDEVLAAMDEKRPADAAAIVRVWVPEKEEAPTDVDSDVDPEEGAVPMATQEDQEAQTPKTEPETAEPKYVVVRGSMKQRTLDDLEPGVGMPDKPVWLEKKHDDAWVRSTVKENWRDFQVGDIIDAKDTVGKWYESKILKVNESKREIFVHYIGWGDNYDVWLSMDSDGIDKQSTHTDGPYEPRKSSGSSYNNYYSSWRASEEGVPPARGAVGLRNLGNTCFMNSTLQCLSHTPLLTDYFLRNRYKDDINRDNPLGWNGRVADEYAAFLRDIWSNKFKIVAPSALKGALGEVAPRFSGYSQQDSQELLSFLLDGLHEDLNQVKKKPATTTVESKGRPDAEVAAEAWNTHQLRNQSIIVDYMQGQLKSRLVCPDCKRVSITFDPFSYLSVPLPQASDNPVTVTYVPADSSKPLLRVTAMLPSLGHIVELKTAVAGIVGAKPTHLQVADIWQGKVHSLLQDDDGLNRIRPNDDVFVYELPDVDTIPIRYLKVFSAFQSHESTHVAEPFGLPVLIAVTTEHPVTGSEIVSKLKAAAQRHITEGTQGLPFSVHLKSWNSSTEIQDDDKEVEVDSRYYSRIEIECEWHDKAGFDAASLEREDHESVALSDGGAEESASSRSYDHSRRGGSSSGSKLSVGACLRGFTKEETLSEQDPWYCSVCKKHQQANKKFDLWKLPEILIIHMKRFKHTRWFREKIDAVVDFPFEGLDMAPFTVNPEEKKNCLYDLYAVSNHMGGLGGGHYNAYVKNLTTHEWWLHDDSSVRPVGDDLSRIVSSNAYVLFYKRRGTAPALASVEATQAQDTPAPAASADARD